MKSPLLIEVNKACDDVLAVKTALSECFVKLKEKHDYNACISGVIMFGAECCAFLIYRFPKPQRKNITKRLMKSFEMARDHAIKRFDDSDKETP